MASSSPKESAESKELKRRQLRELDKLDFQERQAKNARFRMRAGRASLIKTSALGITDQTVASAATIKPMGKKEESLQEFLTRRSLLRKPAPPKGKAGGGGTERIARRREEGSGRNLNRA